MKVIELQGCPRCKGTIVDDSDWQGSNDRCLMCGWTKTRQLTLDDIKITTPGGSTALHKMTKQSTIIQTEDREVTLPLTHGTITIGYIYNPPVIRQKAHCYVQWVEVSDTIFMYEVNTIRQQFIKFGEGILLGMDEFDEYFRENTAREKGLTNGNTIHHNQESASRRSHNPQP